MEGGGEPTVDGELEMVERGAVGQELGLELQGGLEGGVVAGLGLGTGATGVGGIGGAVGELTIGGGGYRRGPDG